MTTVEKIIAAAQQRGLTFVVVNGQPIMRGDPKRVTDALRRAISEFRPEIIDHLKLEASKPAPAFEPDFERTVQTMDSFGRKAIVVEPCGDGWKMGAIAWQYVGDAGWRQIVGQEDKFPAGVSHA